MLPSYESRVGLFPEYTLMQRSLAYSTTSLYLLSIKSAVSGVIVFPFFAYHRFYYGCCLSLSEGGYFFISMRHPWSSVRSANAIGFVCVKSHKGSVSFFISSFRKEMTGYVNMQASVAEAWGIFYFYTRLVSTEHQQQGPVSVNSYW